MGFVKLNPPYAILRLNCQIPLSLTLSHKGARELTVLTFSRSTRKTENEAIVAKHFALYLAGQQVGQPAAHLGLPRARSSLPGCLLSTVPRLVLAWLQPATIVPE